MKALKFKEAHCTNCNAICKVEWGMNTPDCHDLLCLECTSVIATVYGVKRKGKVKPDHDKAVNEQQAVASLAKASPPGVTTAEFVRIEPTVFANDIRNATFEVLAKAMMRWLCENQHPHHTVIITPTSAELLEGSLAFTDESYLKD